MRFRPCSWSSPAGRGRSLRPTGSALGCTGSPAGPPGRPGPLPGGGPGASGRWVSFPTDRGRHLSTWGTSARSSTTSSGSSRRSTATWQQGKQTECNLVVADADGGNAKAVVTETADGYGLILLGGV